MRRDDPRRRISANFNPKEVLEANDDRYVEFDGVRGSKVIAPIVNAINLSDGTAKIYQLFSGPRGTGKSSELKRLQAELENLNFRVVFLDAEDALDLEDFAYPDYLAFLSVSFIDAFRDLPGMSPIQTTVDRLKKNALKFIVEGLSEAEVSVGGFKWVPNFKSMLSAIRSDRDVIESQTTQVVDDINKIIDTATDAILKNDQNGLVVIIDGLDKVPVDHQAALFAGRADSLCSLNAHTIYAAPISFVHSKAVNQWIQAAGIPDRVIPMISLRPPHGKDDETWADVDVYSEGFKVFREIARRRCERAGLSLTQTFGEGTLDHLITMSGGHTRRFMMFVRDALSESENLPIPLDAAERAVKAYADSLFRSIPDEYWEGLRKCDSPQRDIPRDENHLEMLFYLYLHQYQNGEAWYEVNPVIRTLRKFRHPSPQ